MRSWVRRYEGVNGIDVEGLEGAPEDDNSNEKSYISDAIS